MPSLLCLDDTRKEPKSKSRLLSVLDPFDSNSSSPRTEGWPLAPPATLQVAKQEVPLGASEGRASERVVSPPPRGHGILDIYNKDERVKRERGASTALEG